MQSLGNVLFVPLEQGGSNGLIQAWRTSTLSETTCPACAPVFLWSFITETAFASVAGAVKLSTGNFLVATAGEDSELYEFYISSGTNLFRPSLFTPLGGFGKLDISTVAGFRPYYQHISLLTKCASTAPGDEAFAGDLYLIGTTSATFGESGDDYADLFRLVITPGADPAFPGTTHTVTAQWIASKHFYCSSASYERQCDFVASAGTYVDPDGRLLLYASEQRRPTAPDGDRRVGQDDGVPRGRSSR